MKKLILAVLLSVSIAGLAYAHSMSYDPQTTTGGLSLTIPVYSSDTAALDVGDVVVLDVGASTGDNDMWVKTTTTADTQIVVGVVWPNAIPIGGTGSVAIWGLAECDTKLGATDGTLLCTSSVEGDGVECTDNDGAYAVAVTALSGKGQTPCFVNR